MDLSGKRLGHIRVDRILGQGGMGDVYEGFDEKLMRRVALKALHRDQRLDDEARARLIREARTLSQLDHPNICRIHDYIEGADADVLVLELIEGRTLQRAIEEGLSRAEKLRIAHAIAEVLVVAHRFGIVHRDLKPENVMLTKSGVVKVLDFGLARWIEKQKSSGRMKAVKVPTTRMGPKLPIAEEVKEEKWYAFDADRTQVLDGVVRSGNGRDMDDSDAGYTAAGVTVGTPMFMSPEQARGETLTPASDLYSFGLLLQTLFTSEEPYPVEATGREVMLMAARGESLPVKGVHRDIAALIARLKALAPTDRPTAVEAAARLRLISEKPKRMAQYAAVALLIALIVSGTWKYIVDVRRERAAAVAARGDAVWRRGQAEDLISFMVGDLREKLVSVGRLEILDDVAQRALAYEASLTPETMSSEEIARNARALHQLGEVRISQGRIAEAQPIFARALTLANVALARAPKDPEVRLTAAQSHFWMGNAYRLKSQLAPAVREMQAYLDGAEKLAKDYPSIEKYQLERADGHSVVAYLLRQTDPRKSLEHYTITRNIKGALVAAAPEKLDRHAELAMTINNIGFAYIQLGDLRAAQEQFQAEHGIYVRLLAADPTNMVWKRRASINASYLALMLECVGEMDRALETRRAEIAMWTEVVARDETNVDTLRGLAVAHLRTGMILRIKGDLQGALREHDEAKALIDRVIAREPHRPSFRDDAITISLGRARVLLAAHRLPEAAAAIDAADAEVKAGGPTVSLLPRALTGLMRGDLLQARGDTAGAADAWSKAEAVAEVRGRSSMDPMIIDPWVSLLLRLGRSAEAQPLLDRLDQQGYRHPDLVAARQRILGHV